MQADSIRPPQKRRKQATYGKASRTDNPWDVAGLDAFAANEQASPTQPKKQSTALRDTYPVTKPIFSQQAVKSATSRPAKVETWDVPSSDDDDGGFSVVRLRPPTLTVKRKTTDTAQPQALAPWEINEEIRSVTSGRGEDYPASQTHEASQLSGQTLQSSGAARVNGNSAPQVNDAPKAAIVGVGIASRAGPGVSGAAARLQARKQQGQGPNSSAAQHSPSSTKKAGRPDIIAEKHNATSEARVTTTRPNHVVPAKRQQSKSLADRSKTQADKPIVSDEKEHKSTAQAVTSKAAAEERRAQKRLKRTKCDSASGLRRSPSKPAISAPARLTAMVEDLNDPMQIDTSMSENVRVSQQYGRHEARSLTPDSAKRMSSSAVSRAGSITPKQTHTSNKLLPETGAPSSPSSAALQKLTLQGARTVKGVPTLIKSASAVEPRRQRLVDRLKASAVAESDSESSDDMSSEQEDGETEQTTSIMQPRAPKQPHSQSQTAMAAHAGPKITYAKTRSYVQDTTFEESLLLEMPIGSPPKMPAFTRNSSKSHLPSSQTEFDLEGSDDDSKTGGLRSIHELRAGGGNQRFLDDTGGLLDDLSDHRVSGRSRRRSALFDLASKLRDRTFVEKFFRLGYERKLLRECGAAPDQVADFALLACLVALLSGEIPQHTMQHLRDIEVMNWSAGFLLSGTSAIRIARDRTNNMSRSAQDSMVSFSSTFIQDSSIWGECDASTRLTARVLALKVFDQIIRNLRNAGVTAELVDLDTIRAITPSVGVVQTINDDADKRWEHVLAISVLESLSTLTQSLTWPAEVIESVASLLVNTDPEHGPDEHTQHFQFLLLRLSLNLTNDNARNCKHFCVPAPVPHLLRMIRTGFDRISAPIPPSSSPSHNEKLRALALDLLVLAMGIAINIAETATTHSENISAAFPTPPLTPRTRPTIIALVSIFRAGQQRTQAAESVEETITNVAFGYLAIVLACLSRDPPTRSLVAAHLTGGSLAELIAAVDEFVLHHQRVDMLNAEAQIPASLESDDLETNTAVATGAAVWSAFTERLQEIARRLRDDARAV